MRENKEDESDIKRAKERKRERERKGGMREKERNIANSIYPDVTLVRMGVSLKCEKITSVVGTFGSDSNESCLF